MARRQPKFEPPPGGFLCSGPYRLEWLRREAEHRYGLFFRCMGGGCRQTIEVNLDQRETPKYPLPPLGRFYLLRCTDGTNFEVQEVS